MLQEIRESPIFTELVLLYGENQGNNQKVTIQFADLAELQNRHVFGKCNQKP